MEVGFWHTKTHVVVAWLNPQQQAASSFAINTDCDISLTDLVSIVCIYNNQK